MLVHLSPVSDNRVKANQTVNVNQTMNKTVLPDIGSQRYSILRSGTAVQNVPEDVVRGRAA